MKSIAPMLEQEQKGAVDIKDKKFLHRYITLMAENFVQKDEHMTEVGSIRSDTQILGETMMQGFERVDRRFENMLSLMDRRFEAVDKRFDDMNKRFTMMFSFITIGFVVVTTLVTVYQFLG